MLKILACLFLLCFAFGDASKAKSYNIFVLFPLPSKSHGNLGEGYVRHLLNAGHKVTYATPFTKREPHPNLRIIDLSSGFNAMSQDVMNLERVINKEIDITSMTFPIMLGFANNTLANPNIQELLRNPKETFDLVIYEWMFSDAYSGFGPIFNAPYIIAAPMELDWMTLQLMDDLPNPSYTVDILSSVTTPLSFIERAQQLFHTVIEIFMRQFSFSRDDELIYYKYFAPAAKARGIVLPPFSEARFNASLMLANSHVSMGDPVSMPQNCKGIGGYHIDTDIKPLPQDLQKIMDSSKYGVIYFSMGSNLRSSSFPVSIKRDLLRLFGKFKQTVLWKFEDDALTDIPSNVHILKWAPQPSILNHTNTKIFITHGGLLSTTEAIHFGVPIIGMPVFGDQFINVARATSKGFAMTVHWSYNVGEELEKALTEMLTNKKYQEKVNELSYVYHDRVVPPGVELTHWVRHVIETRGAPLLRSPALALAWYQRYYIDLAVMLLAVFLIVILAVKRLVNSVSDYKKVKIH